ncbi:MAG TPA: hypothetical protein VHI52_10730 [Verrucomicrobiae bacterium]|nr:hypothetical protein [Verrucomicrobiae bacterium]
MARRKVSAGDWLRGAAASMRNGTASNPFATQKHINAAHDERMARMERDFGNGKVGGDRNWTSPVHGTTLEGRPVTIAFGKGVKEGQTLVADGHIGMRAFYAKRHTGLGHDHYLVDGTIASKIDTKRFK